MKPISTLAPMAAGLSLILGLTLGGAAMAQEPEAPPAQTAEEAEAAILAKPGVTLAEAAAWLTTAGATVGEPGEASGRMYLPVNDGVLTWTLWFYGCPEGFCDDLQFGAVFKGQGVTQEKINAWNRDNRFLKAFFVPGAEGEEPRAAVQYDVVLTAPGMLHLSEPAGLWIDMLKQFARAMGFAAPTPQDAADAPSEAPSEAPTQP